MLRSLELDVASKTHRYDFHYTSLGALRSITHLVDGVSSTSNYYYNSAGDLDHIDDPEGGTEQFLYDFIGRVREHSFATLSGASLRWRERSTYTPEGHVGTINLLDQTSGSSVTVDRVYAFDRLGRVRQVSSGTSPSDTLAQYDYTGSRLSRAVESWAGASRDFTYQYSSSDPASVASLATSGGTPLVNYLYNNVGDVRERTSTVSGVPGAKFEYDALRRPTRAGSSRFLYGATGERIAEYPSNAASLSLRLGGIDFDYTNNGSGIFQRTRVRVDSGVRAWMNDGTTTIQRQLFDHQGNLAVVRSTGAGDSVLRRAFSVFGETISGAAPTGVYRGFQDGASEATSASVHFGARQFDPFSKGWLSFDPLHGAVPEASIRGDSPFSFVGGNPVSYSDPSGLILDDRCTTATGCERYWDTRVAELPPISPLLHATVTTTLVAATVTAAAAPALAGSATVAVARAVVPRALLTVTQTGAQVGNALSRMIGSMLAEEAGLAMQQAGYAAFRASGGRLGAEALGYGVSVTSWGSRLALGGLAAGALRGGGNRSTPVRVSSNGVDAESGSTDGLRYVRQVPRGTSIRTLAQEMRDMQGELESEILLFSHQNGTYHLYAGGRTSATFQLPPQVRRLMAHTHPFRTGPSTDDYETIQAMGQRSSWILEVSPNRFSSGFERFRLSDIGR